jgi:TolA-binding protein
MTKERHQSFLKRGAKMSKHYLVIILGIGLLLQNCSTLKSQDGSSQEEATTSKDTSIQPEKETVATKMEVEYLQQQIDRLQEENSRIQDENKSELAQVNAQNEALKEEIELLKQEITKINQEQKVTISKKADIKEEGMLSSSDLSKLVKNTQRVNIKVLAGDGNLVSAKNMFKKLSDMGYRVDSIGSAPRSDFQTTTIYFEPIFQNQAKELALRMGSNVIVKPLSWPSIFDLIVVTGKNP